MMRLIRDDEWDHDWVVCFAPSCGVRFAKRLPALPRHGLLPTLVAGPGWVTDGLTWWMPSRVWKRISRGQEPAFRRLPPWERRMHRRWRLPKASKSSGGFVLNLPAEVLCPGCGRWQLADAVALDAPGSQRRRQFAER
jgi:hypothetical protein